MLAKENVKRLGDIMGVESDEHLERLRECLADGIPHNVLNAKYHEREAEIISEAGRVGAVTIATNMAGRGVDILLGGTADNEDRKEQSDKVIELGGLFILGSERHESRRIDNQLRGRAGRQGDPGASRFHISLEDELWRVFGDKSQSPWLASWEEDMAMPSKILSKMIERTQMKMESHYFDMRKNVLQYDDVMNVQREAIYGQRRRILEGVDLRQTVHEYLHKIVSDAVNSYCAPHLSPSEWDFDTLYEYLDDIFPVHVYATVDHLKGKKPSELEEFILEIADQTYEDREKEMTPEVVRQLERDIALRVINDKWMEHLDSMDYLREGIGLRGYAQIDPLVAYKKEGFEMFDRMLEEVQDEMVRWLFRIQVVQQPEQPYNPYKNVQMSGGDYVPTSDFNPAAGFPEPNQGPRSQTPVHVRSKVGRNDPCPCGSGKKYKKCCGAGD
jgi:preprotein translocase subunit SecA